MSTKTLTKKKLIAAPMLALAVAPTFASVAPAIAAEAPSSNVTLNSTLANSSLKVTGGEGPVQVLTNGRGGCSSPGNPYYPEPRRCAQGGADY